jgi:hypothetical protein
MATKRQAEIPGTERKSIKEVDDAAELYRSSRDARMKKSKIEKEKKIDLVQVMLKHGLSVYRDDNAVPPIVVTVTSKHDVKVTNIEGEEVESDEALN